MNKELVSICNKIKINLYNNKLEDKNYDNINISINNLLKNLTIFVHINNIEFDLNNLDNLLNDFIINLLIPILNDDTITFYKFTLKEIENLSKSFNIKNDKSNFNEYFNLIEKFKFNINKFKTFDTDILSKILLEEISESIIINEYSILYPNLKNIISIEIYNISNNLINDKKIIIEKTTSKELEKLLIFLNKNYDHKNKSFFNEHIINDEFNNTIPIKTSLKLKLTK